MNMPALNINDLIYSWIQIASSVILCYVIPLNIFLLTQILTNLTLYLDSLILLYILAIFQNDLRSIILLLFKYLNFKFLYLKLCIKDEFLDRIVTNIWLT